MNSLRDGASGKALGLGIGVLLLGGTYFAVIAPLSASYAATAERLEERQELIRRYQNAASDLPRLRAVATQRQDQPPDADLLLTGSTDPVAAAAMQSVLKVLVELEGAKLNSAEMLPPETADNIEDNAVRRVGVRIAFTGNLNLLATVLEGVETTRPVLSVGNLDIRTERDEEDDNPTLVIVMDVYGFYSR